MVRFAAASATFDIACQDGPGRSLAQEANHAVIQGYRQFDPRCPFKRTRAADTGSKHLANGCGRGEPAECLSNFYAATLALVLQGSVEPSAEKFNQASANIWTVREAWRQAASGPESPELMSAELQLWTERSKMLFAFRNSARWKNHMLRQAGLRARARLEYPSARYGQLFFQLLLLEQARVHPFLARSCSCVPGSAICPATSTAIWHRRGAPWKCGAK